MLDEDFLELFEQCTLPKEHFKHKTHLRIAWLYLSKYNFDQAMRRITQGIQKYASSIGSENVYHETLTRVWVYLVKNEMKFQAETFEQFIKKNPKLLDQKLPLQYFTKERLDSDQARMQWIAPDIKRLMN